MKKKTFLFITISLIFIALLPLLNLARKDIRQNLAFNREFAKKLYNHDFLLKYLNIALYKINISSTPDHLFIGKDKWLFLGDFYAKSSSLKRFPPDQELIDHIKKINLATQEWKLWLQKRNINLYKIYICPDKETIYSEYLPDWFKINENNATNTLLKHVNPDIYLNLEHTLKKAKEKYQFPLFYKSDSHWNNLGGWEAFNEIQHNIKKNLPHLKLVEENQIFIEKSIYRKGGDIAGLMKMSEYLHDSEVEILNQYEPMQIQQYDFVKDELIYEGENIPIGIPFKPVLIKSPYALNQAKVFWIHDSFGTAMSKFFANLFSETLQMEFYFGNLEPQQFKELLDKFNPDYVIITTVERDILNKWFTNSPPK